MAEQQAHYATAHHPTIAAVVEERFRFRDKAQALARILAIKEHFTASRHQPEAAEGSAVLWIKGYGLTPEEEKQGYIGHYALISHKPTGDGKITLFATKLESELKYHPQRRRPPRRHPNWGHPVLRAVRKRRHYDTLEQAQSELDLLHEEFPEVSIPGAGKLYLMIYGKAEPGEKPVRKYILEIETAPEGGFFIVVSENAYAAPLARRDTAPAEPPQGYFSSMVALKRKRARRQPIPRQAPEPPAIPKASQEQDDGEPE